MARPCLEALPFYDDFEATTLNSCWGNGPVGVDGVTFEWSRGSGETASYDTGPSAAQTGSNYIFMEASYPRVQGDVAILSFDCQMDTSSNIYPKLRFYYHMYGKDMGSLYVDVFESDNLNYGIPPWSIEFSRTGQQHSATTSAWSLGVVDLPHDPALRFRFRGEWGGYYGGDMAFDSVRPSGLLSTFDAEVFFTLTCGLHAFVRCIFFI